MIEDLWYKNAVIYSLDLETFVDGNGDGVGDIAGLIARLDYLHTLGVDVIWIAPLHPSPQRDNGYDVVDFYGVDPRYGTPGELVELVHQAKTRGLKVIMDLVVNHTSDQHPWFQRARTDPDSRVGSFYLWSKKRPPDWNEGMVFPGVQRATWTYDKAARRYYFHRFHEFQPDLNIDNPEVRAEILRIMGYWLQIGVDGFRVDAVPFIIEHPDLGDSDVQSAPRFEYLAEMREFMDWRASGAVMLGEANVLPDETRKYFRDGNGIHLMFNFWVNQRLFYALATSDVEPLVEALRETRELPRTAQWAQFLRNHDELDLGRLSDEQRAKVFEQFGPEPAMQLYGRGIRRRLAPMLGTRARSELAYSVAFSLPGTPVIRYGDEIGMGDDLTLEQREAVRTPMQWSSERHGGFTTSNHPVHPVIDRGPYDYRHVNVSEQRHDPSSMLRWMIDLIRIRKECPEIGWGTWEILKTGAPSVLAMRYDWRGSSVLTIHNFDAAPHELVIDVGCENAENLLDLWRPQRSEAEADGRHRLALDAHEYRWFRVGGLNYALVRAEGASRRYEEARGPACASDARKKKKKKTATPARTTRKRAKN